MFPVQTLFYTARPGTCPIKASTNSMADIRCYLSGDLILNTTHGKNQYMHTFLSLFLYNNSYLPFRCLPFQIYYPVFFNG